VSGRWRDRVPSCVGGSGPFDGLAHEPRQHGVRWYVSCPLDASAGRTPPSSAGSVLTWPGLAGGDDGLGEVGLTFQLVSMGRSAPFCVSRGSTQVWMEPAALQDVMRTSGVCSLPAECAKVGQIPGPGPPQGLLDGQVLTLCDQLLGGKDAERAAILAVQLNLLGGRRDTQEQEISFRGLEKLYPGRRHQLAGSVDQGQTTVRCGRLTTRAKASGEISSRKGRASTWSIRSTSRAESNVRPA
jgi:hypothetical protein